MDWDFGNSACMRQCDFAIAEGPLEQRGWFNAMPLDDNLLLWEMLYIQLKMPKFSEVDKMNWET